ncbi:MAG: ABC transporter ATP-binding protein/permease [Myxococcales bacterium]|nr:ABC transporter ATP-binding protein/permease [Myxococcales bacterium]
MSGAQAKAVSDARKRSMGDISNREAFAVLLRAFGYLKPVKNEMIVKGFLVLLSLTPWLLLPWPTKIVIDHIVGGRAIDDVPKPYPFFVRPFVEMLVGMSPAGMATVMFFLFTVLIVVLGAWSLTSADRTQANLAQGTDLASRTENEANEAESYVGGILGYFEYRWTLRITHALNHRYRADLFERIQRMPMTSIDDQRIGDAVYRVMYDTPSITRICYRLALTPILAPIHVALAVAALAFAYGDVNVVIYTALGILPAVLVITLPFSGIIRRTSGEARDTGAHTTTTIEESINNILAVQSLGAQAREKERFDRDSWASYGGFRKLAVAWIGMLAIAVVAVSVIGTIVFYELTDRIFAETLTVGDLTVVYAYYFQIAISSARFGRLWIDLQARAVGMARVFDLMDAPSDLQPDNPAPLPDVREGYVFEDVGFHYPDGTKALSGASLEAKRGTLVALAGPAGAGKTTLAYMFPRFLWPSEGRILIDGVDLTTVDREALRQNTAFVFQEPVLFDATVADNIRVGKPDATLEQMREAARVAGALEFIEHLPQGFDTPLGRNGGRLSVGQKQRLSIARALVRNAPVLVLDEPTAALDPETELRLVSALREASRDKLVVVIAHRLSTIRHADQILFLQEGKIAERGTHDELMTISGGAYRRFVELQRGVPDAAE